MPDGKRRLSQLAAVIGLEGANVKVQDIFKFRQTGMEDGTVRGYFTGTGVIPRCLMRIRNVRIDLPVDIFLPHS